MSQPVEGHTLENGITQDEAGYRADCTCGWKTFGCAKEEEAQDAFDKHLDYRRAVNLQTLSDGAGNKLLAE